MGKCDSSTVCFSYEAKKNAPISLFSDGNDPGRGERLAGSELLRTVMSAREERQQLGSSPPHTPGLPPQ